MAKWHFAKITVWSYIVVFSCFEIPQFRGPQTVGPVPSAVGVSIAIDKITAAVSSVEDSVSFFFGKWGICLLDGYWSFNNLIVARDEKKMRCSEVFQNNTILI